MGGLFLFAAGCKHPNSPRSDDDLRIRVELTREFVRANMMDTPKDLSVAHGIAEQSLKMEADDLGQAVFESLFCLLVLAPIAYGVENAAEHAYTTKGYIWPRERPEYRQRLYWGDNRVYLPRECAGEIVPFVVEFRGNYAGTYEVLVDMSRRRASVRLSGSSPHSE